MENTKELNTFEKLIVKIQTGSWDDLAYLEMTLERNFSMAKTSKQDRKVHNKLISLIEERKSEMKYHEDLKAIHIKEIKSIKPNQSDFETME